MSLLTDPIFYYIDPIETGNLDLNFIEPNAANTELNAQLNVGSYSMDALKNELARVLNATGQNEYTVTFDRDARTFTISADDSFNLLVSSGSNVSTSVFTTIGFTGADRSGGSSYTGSEAGKKYQPQFPLQKFVGFDISKQPISAKVNESASGEVEVVTFGTKRIMKFNITYITDKGLSKNDPKVSKSNVQDAIDFMEFITDKNELEFMPDRTNRAVFDTILLESTPTDKNGAGYELKELYQRNLLGYFETGLLRFRKL